MAPRSIAPRKPATDQKPIISIRGVVNKFGTQLVHDGVDLDVYPGEVLGIVGGSGSGKSVLLRTMLGLNKPAAGQVLIEGKDITQVPEAELIAVKQRYGVTFQQGALFSSLTVAENIELPIREYFRVSTEALAELVELRLRMVGLPVTAGAKLPSQLSGGMIKRAALARALALDPSLLFLDEPTAGLDPISAADFDELVLYLQRGLKLTVVMITHDLDTLVTTCDRVAVLVDRKIVVDTLDGIMKNPHPWIQEYFHGPRSRAVQATANKASDDSGPDSKRADDAFAERRGKPEPRN
jgi:phospholipid/cholesterol/gamma-HCH transport system ATP-binding protein